MQGWVKFYREMLDNPVVCKDAEHFAIWSYLLLKANRKEKDVTFAGERITLKPGQLLTGRKQIASHFNISESKVQRVLKKFEEEQQIEQKSSNKSRLISITNWDAMQQPKEEPNNQQAAPQEVPQQAPEEVLPLQIIEESAQEVAAGKEVKVLNHKEIMQAWNSLGLSQIKKIAGTRLASTKARIKEYGSEEFMKAISMISESTFLQGGGDRGWTINYDWFLKPNNFIKVLEGNYTDKCIPKLNSAVSGLSAKVQRQNQMLTHGNLYDNIEELERKLIDAKIAEMNKTKAQA